MTQPAPPLTIAVVPPSSWATWTSTVLVRALAAGAVVALDLERALARGRR